MIQKWHFYSALTVIIIALSSGFKSFTTKKPDTSLTHPQQQTPCLFPSEKKSDYVYGNTPFTSSFFVGFKEAMGFKESQNKYKKVNTLGYLGKYQFGFETLKTVGLQDSVAFLNSPQLQERAFVALLSKNKWELQREIRTYNGKVINGTRITESGILAAAHLGGVKSVRNYLRNNGKSFFKDAYGMSIRTYFEDFSGFDTSSIVPIKNARVSCSS